MTAGPAQWGVGQPQLRATARDNLHRPGAKTLGGERAPTCKLSELGLVIADRCLTTTNNRDTDEDDDGDDDDGDDDNGIITHIFSNRSIDPQ